MVDRAADRADGRVVVALVDGHFVRKRLSWRDERWWLVAEHPDYPGLPVTEETSV